MDCICAGIVSFNPDIQRLKQNIDSILCQVDLVYLVDNGSCEIDLIKIIVDSCPKIKFIQNKENLGIATGLNQMCENAQKCGYKWIVTLDQDTIVPKDMLAKMNPYTNNSEFGIICPAVYYEGWGKNTATSEPATYVYACMTSASLTNIAAWQKVGGFRNDYFIDFVDNEFCMKLRRAGYKIIRVNDCVISHELGKAKKYNLFGLISIKCSEHSPWRFYYMTRNNLVFIREYKKFLSVPKEFLKLAYILATGYLASSNRKETLRYIKMGLQHVKNKHMGKLEQ